MFEIPAWAGNGCDPPVDPQKWTPDLRTMLKQIA
jgi:hypothetical protein